MILNNGVNILDEILFRKKLIDEINNSYYYKNVV